MGEVFGVHRAEGLRPEDLTAFKNMKAYAEKNTSLTAVVHENNYSCIGLLQKHNLDSTNLVVNTESGVWLSAIGPSPLEKDINKLYNEIQSDHFDSSRLPQPPFIWILGRPDSPLWIISDPFGLQPLNIHHHEDGLTLFSSRILPLVATAKIALSVDSFAIAQIFEYEHPLGNRTVLKEVSLIPPAVLYNVDKGCATDFAPPLVSPPEEHTSLKDQSLNFFNNLSDAIEHDSANKQVAITLSGGLDSRAILGCAVNRGIKPLTVTFETPGSQDANIAQEISKKANLKHLEIPFDSNYIKNWIEHVASTTDGAFSINHARICMLRDILQSEADIVLDGLGGDAFTGGHLTPFMLNYASHEKGISAIRKMRSVGKNFDTLLHPEFLAEYSKLSNLSIRKHFNNLTPKETWWGCHRFDFLERQRRFIQFGPHLLRDIVQVATPFYNPNVTLGLLSMTRSSLFEQRGYLHMHRNWLNDLALIPDDTRNVPVSWPFAARFSKHLYDVGRRKLTSSLSANSVECTNTPEQWYRTSLKNFVEEILLGNSLLEDVINYDSLRIILAEHNSRAVNHATLIGSLLSLVTFFRLAEEALSEN